MVFMLLPSDAQFSPDFRREFSTAACLSRQARPSFFHLSIFTSVASIMDETNLIRAQGAGFSRSGGRRHGSMRVRVHESKDNQVGADVKSRRFAQFLLLNVLVFFGEPFCV